MNGNFWLFLHDFLQDFFFFFLLLLRRRGGIVFEYLKSLSWSWHISKPNLSSTAGLEISSSKSMITQDWLSYGNGYLGAKWIGNRRSLSSGEIVWRASRGRLTRVDCPRLSQMGLIRCKQLIIYMCWGVQWINNQNDRYLCAVPLYWTSIERVSVNTSDAKVHAL